jgi:hypothetical protein
MIAEDADFEYAVQDLQIAIAASGVRDDAVDKCDKLVGSMIWTRMTERRARCIQYGFEFNGGSETLPLPQAKSTPFGFPTALLTAARLKGVAPIAVMQFILDLVENQLFAEVVDLLAEFPETTGYDVKGNHSLHGLSASRAVKSSKE